jgi:4-hydroxy 2-oxovalerate aldolase
MIQLFDSTLRDGNHAIKHKITAEQIANYTALADDANIPVIIVGHGNGLGASSLQVGESSISDTEMLKAALGARKKSKIGVLVLPGFATINKNLRTAIELGVDVFCVGSHCTEADTTKRQIEYVKIKGKEAYGVLMMSHMATPEELANQVLKMEVYGARGVIIMDSSGTLLPEDVKSIIQKVSEKTRILLGFHAHNNLGLATANSLAAIDAGAQIIDSCSRGLGAGAGNAQIEAIAAVLEKKGIATGIELKKILDAGDYIEEEFKDYIPHINSINVASGMAGVFSGFIKHVQRVSTQYGVDPKDVFFNLGKRRVVAGQEDIIIEVAMDIAEKDARQHKI